MILAGGDACASLPYAQASVYAVCCSCCRHMAACSSSDGQGYADSGPMQAFLTEFARVLGSQAEDDTPSSANDLTWTACCVTSGVVELLRAPFHQDNKDPHLLCQLVGSRPVAAIATSRCPKSLPCFPFPLSPSEGRQKTVLALCLGCLNQKQYNDLHLVERLMSG